jgi:hypothetical protein
VHGRPMLILRARSGEALPTGTTCLIWPAIRLPRSSTVWREPTGVWICCSVFVWGRYNKNSSWPTAIGIGSASSSVTRPMLRFQCRHIWKCSATGTRMAISVWLPRMA